VIPDAVGKKLIGLVKSKDEIADLLKVSISFGTLVDELMNMSKLDARYAA
jgi:hypothetical protein